MILFSRTLDPSLYGAYQQFWVQLLLFSTLACAGIQSVVLTFPRDVVRGGLRSIRPGGYGLFSAWILLWAIVFGWMYNPVLGLSATVAGLFQLVYSLTVLTEAVLISFARFRPLICVNLGYALFFSAIHAGYATNSFAMPMLFFLLFLLTIGKALLLLIFLIPGLKRSGPADQASIKAMRRMWLQLGIYDVIQISFRWIDKFIMALFLSGALFAVYFNGSVDIPFLPLVFGAAGSAALMMMAGQERDRPEAAIKLMHHTSRLLSSVIFPAFFCLILFRYELFDVLFSTRYREAVPVFLAATLVLPLRAYNFTTILQNRGRGGIINLGAAADLVLACGLMYPFYLWLGLPGVALSFVFSTYLQALFYLVATSRLLKISVVKLVPWQNWLWKGALCFIAIYILQLILPQSLAAAWRLAAGITLSLLLMIFSLRLELRRPANHQNKY